MSTQVFFCEICEIFKNTFFTEQLRWLLLSCREAYLGLRQACMMTQPFLKNEKNALILEKKFVMVFIYVLNFSFEMLF